MQLTNGVQMAIAGFGFSQAVVGGPVAFPLPAPMPSPPASLQMYPATVASIGGAHLEYYATHATLSRRGLERRNIASIPQRIKCGINGGGLENYDEGRARFQTYFGTLTTMAGSAGISAVTWIAQNSLCGDVGGGTCDLVVSVGMKIAGLLVPDGALDGYFDRTFDIIREECQGTGGSAELIADATTSSESVCGVPTCTDDGKMGYKVGTFESMFYFHDGGDTCPANPPPTDFCEITSFN